MTFSRILSAAVILLFVTSVGKNLKAGTVSWKGGIGYDYFSQQYFADSTINPGPDSFLTRIALTSNFLNDFKGIAGFAYSSADSRTLGLQTTYEQTSTLVRTKFLSDFRPKVGASRLEWHSEVDWRDRYSGSASPGDSYLLGSTSLKLKVPSGASTTLWAQGQADGVYFYGNTDYSYNYFRGGGKIGFDRLVGDLNILQVDAFVLGREVPDSSSLSYFSGGFDGSLFGSFGRFDLDFMARLERKEYAQTDNEDNYTRFELDGRNRAKISGNYFCRWDLTADLTWYPPSSLINSTYQRIVTSVLGGYQFSGWSLAFGPESECLHEEPAELAEREDYFELGGQASLDIVRPGGLVGSFESTTGHRTITYPTDFLTSFAFERLNVLADWTIYGGLNFNALVSIEWEWHSDPSNNNRLYLISSSLTYRF